MLGRLEEYEVDSFDHFYIQLTWQTNVRKKKYSFGRGVNLVQYGIKGTFEL